MEKGVTNKEKEKERWRPCGAGLGRIRIIHGLFSICLSQISRWRYVSRCDTYMYFLLYSWEGPECYPVGWVYLMPKFDFWELLSNKRSQKWFLFDKWRWQSWSKLKCKMRGSCKWDYSLELEQDLRFCISILSYFVILLHLKCVDSQWRVASAFLRGPGDSAAASQSALWLQTTP